MVRNLGPQGPIMRVREISLILASLQEGRNMNSKNCRNDNASVGKRVMMTTVMRAKGMITVAGITWLTCFMFPTDSLYKDIF